MDPETAPAERCDVIDEFGDISEIRKPFLKALASTETRHRQLLEQMKSWYADSPAAEDFTEKGQRYELHVSGRRNETVVDLRAAHKALGLRRFLKVCTVTLKALGEFLTAPEIRTMTSLERIGWRSYVPSPLAEPGEPQKAIP